VNVVDVSSARIVLQVDQVKNPFSIDCHLRPNASFWGTHNPDFKTAGIGSTSRSHRRRRPSDNEQRTTESLSFQGFHPPSNALTALQAYSNKAFALRLYEPHRLCLGFACDANVFIADLASRLKSRVQLSADGHLEAVERALG